MTEGSTMLRSWKIYPISVFPVFLSKENVSRVGKDRKNNWGRNECFRKLRTEQGTDKILSVFRSPNTSMCNVRITARNLQNTVKKEQSSKSQRWTRTESQKIESQKFTVSLIAVSVISNTKKEKHTNVRTYDVCLYVCMYKIIKSQLRVSKAEMWNSHMNSLWNLLTLKWELDPGVQRLSSSWRQMGGTPRGSATHLWRRELEQWAGDDGRTKKWRWKRVGKRAVKWIAQLKEKLF